jgi:hypothetical protein
MSINLADTIKAMRPMVPAKDFEISKRFYVDLGFEPRIVVIDNLIQMSLGDYSFLLQNYYVQDWADNFVIHLFVSDLGKWWDHILAVDLASRYGIKTSAPQRESWGALVAGFIDPAGVLWRIHQTD